MCKYCESLFNKNVIPEDLIFGSLEVSPFRVELTVNTFIDRHTSPGEPRLYLGLDTNDHTLIYKSIKINYCPICGEKLNKD